MRLPATGASGIASSSGRLPSPVVVVAAVVSIRVAGAVSPPPMDISTSSISGSMKKYMRAVPAAMSTAAAEEEVDESSLRGNRPGPMNSQPCQSSQGTLSSRAADDAHLDLHDQELGWAEHLQLAGESVGFLDMEQWEDEPLKERVAHEEQQEGEGNRGGGGR